MESRWSVDHLLHGNPIYREQWQLRVQAWSSVAAILLAAAATAHVVLIAAEDRTTVVRCRRISLLAPTANAAHAEKCNLTVAEPSTIREQPPPTFLY